MNGGCTPEIADLRRWFIEPGTFDAALAKGPAFDRAMVAHDAAVAAKAWDEGAKAATEGDWRGPLQGNPYGGPNA